MLCGFVYFRWKMRLRESVLVGEGKFVGINMGYYGGQRWSITVIFGT